MNPSSSNPVRALQRWRHQLTVPQFTVVTGLLVIVLATLLLSTPLCSNSNVGLWQALFTATSAITVTGLSVIDIGEDLTFAGQVVLAGLIITGGLGLMAITTFLQGFVQGRSGLRNRLDKGRALDEFGVGGIGPTFHSILLVALCVMGLGTVVLYSFGFTDIEDPGRRLWAAMFHAISAYNNAGFGLWSNSLESYRDNPVVTGVIAFMIVIGGIGWRVANDIWNNRFRLGRLRRLSLHTRLVIRSTALLIVIGAVGLLITEHIGYGASAMEPYGWLEDLQIVLFQSITTRTAGFNTIPLSAHQITDAGLLLIILLMFIGASPGGTGGGVKTTTFAILMGATRSTLQGRSHVLLHRRQIPDATVLRAVGVTLASALFVVLMALTLGLGNSLGQQQVQSFSFLEKLFTCVSAFGTVGLDLGVTAHLNRWGQLVLMVGMFVGRVGILLLLSALYGTRPQSRVGYPKEDLYV
ncbi:MAG: potassium transporter TrkG [Cyanobacteria bacterium]|jgi:trk system potassium uptake protein TrkH|uniref:TrkH family potassium uptake protein n=1 Tax=Synechococcaceae TaxID=1890426 RepID=UPI000319AD03|nr:MULTISPECIES: potassium transporter TrkG [Synechococcaceae]MDA0727470.1 potassium transporter TrkG [Cyanobacteriota bacterium]MDA0964875.1 potassium transporter TrkG [Cyanobacteriota bacterium]MDA1155953.1 potassium transporter TrkG [Cyanobacteriota bacterium]PWL23145.1 MAG: potassium transporter TrkG [Synechococcus sp. XM-24]